jgi:hypothetical protein
MRALTYLTAFCLLITPLCAADAPTPAEAKLRESLRATMLQLRTAESERAALQAAQTEMEEKSKALAEQVAKMEKQIAEEKELAEMTGAELKAKVDERDREIGDLRLSLDKWKVAHQKVTDIANAKEAQRAKAAMEVIVLNRKVAEQQVKNAAMFKLGNEILTRYEKFGLGDALTSREPFVGITRVKFQNLIQDYGDKLADEKIKPDEKPAPDQPAKPAPAKAPAKPAGKKATS